MGLYIMSVIRVFLLSLCLGAVSACSSLAPYGDNFYDREARSILPSEDPLVLAWFERNLNDNDISYKRNYQGHYSAVDPEDSGALIALGKKARNKRIERESVQVGQDCASRRLQGFLRDAGALFVFVKEDNGYFLHIRARDVADIQVQERLAQFQAECAAGRQE